MGVPAALKRSATPTARSAQAHYTDDVTCIFDRSRSAEHARAYAPSASCIMAMATSSNCRLPQPADLRDLGDKPNQPVLLYILSVVKKFGWKCTRINLRRGEIQKFFWGGMPPDPPSWSALMHTLMARELPLWPHHNILVSPSPEGIGICEHKW